MRTADWASVAAAAFAAGAATAAWATVWLSVRRDRALHKPNVSASFTVQEIGRRAGILFGNGGPGLAVGLCYVGVVGSKVFGGYVGAGLLQAGTEREEALDLLLGRNAKPLFVWACRDVDNNGHVWANDGRRIRVDRKQMLEAGAPTVQDHFRFMYPDTPLA